MKTENNPFENQIFTDPSDESNVVNLPAKRTEQVEPDLPPMPDEPPAWAYESGKIPEGGSYKGKKFSFIGGRELFTPKPIAWLVSGAIEVDTLVSLYGASGSGKSFVAIDMGLCIATGQSWHGHKVKAGKVVYVAGEGKAGIKRRITAWAQRHGGHEQIEENFLLSGSVCLLPDDGKEFIESLRELPELRLLILDTLQRTYIGDENSSKDMTAYVQAVDKIREAMPDLVVMVVHHTGHRAEGRARGSSVLKASLDSEIKVEQRGKHRIIEHTKAKESEPFKPIAFELKTEILIDDGWRDEDGGQITSATLHHDPDFVFSQTKAGRTERATTQVKALRVLDNLLADCKGCDRIEFERWEKACVLEKIAVDGRRFRANVAKPMDKKGSITIHGSNEFVSLTEQVT